LGVCIKASDTVNRSVQPKVATTGKHKQLGSARDDRANGIVQQLLSLPVLKFCD
jgi:hypothetical protein